MPVNAVISIGCFAVSNALLHHQNRRLRKQNAQLSTGLFQSAETIQYMAEIIERNEVPITEFDLIALQAIAEKIR